MVNATVHDPTVACGTKSRNRIMSTGVAYGALGVAGHPNRAALGEARAGSRSSGSCLVSRPDRPGLGPHYLNKVWPFPKAYNYGRDVTVSRHLAHADLSACSPHRVMVCHHVIALPAESAYREAHPLDRGTERADEDYRGGGLRGSSEFFTLVQRMSHARSTLPRVTTGPHMRTGAKPPGS